MKRKYQSTQKRSAIKLICLITGLILLALATQSFALLPSHALRQNEQQCAQGRTKPAVAHYDRDMSQNVIVSYNSDTLLCSVSRFTYLGWTNCGGSTIAFADGPVTLGRFTGGYGEKRYVYVFGRVTDPRVAAVSAKLVDNGGSGPVKLDIAAQKTVEGKLYFLVKYYSAVNKAGSHTCALSFSDADGGMLYFKLTP